jgi:hypothetical protein
VDEGRVESSDSASKEDAEILEVVRKKSRKDRPEGEIDFRGTLNEDARAE